MRILPLGTSRLHRAFLNSDDGVILSNPLGRAEIIYPCIGYFHGPWEILQVCRWIRGVVSLPANIASYSFRREPPSTTPMNHFSDELYQQLVSGLPPTPPQIDLDSIDVLLVEISSLLTLKHKGVEIFLHSNPNIPESMRNIQLSKWGDYASHVDFEIIRSTATIPHLVSILRAIKSIFVGKIIVMGHLVTIESPNPDRLKLNSALRDACLETDIQYIDVASYVDRWGFRELNGHIDIHHMTHLGEFALGADILRLLGAFD